MDCKMFCFQCEQTTGGTGCTKAAGACGKKAETATLQDELTGAVIGLARFRQLLLLADAFGCGVNELPLSMVLSWYEQKAVCILLTLLHLGIKDILLGPSLPAFISPNVLNVLVENYNIGPISTVEEDMKKLLG